MNASVPIAIIREPIIYEIVIIVSTDSKNKSNPKIINIIDDINSDLNPFTKTCIFCYKKDM